MTRAQFARAVGADEKWVENTARQLARPLACSVAEARWLGLVRLLVRDIDLPAARAAELATLALREPPESRAVVLPMTESAVGVTIDLARYHSAFGASLSAALHIVQPRRRGRPAASSRAAAGDPLAAAEAHGVDLSLLRESLRLTPAERLARLDEDAGFVEAIRPVGASGEYGSRRAG